MKRFMILSLLVLIGAGCAVEDEAAEGSSEVEAETSDSGESQTEESEQDAFVPKGVSFDEISKIAADSTDLQFEEAVAQYIGTEVTWKGEVEEVAEDLFDDGSFSINVDPDGGDVLERASLKVSKEEALEVPKDASITFTGTINEITNTFGVDVQITPIEYSTS